MELSKSVHPDPTPTPSGTSGVNRDADVWLTDGNCVVVAKDTAFRVYKGILSLHSELFRDLFSLPNSSSGNDMMDGCPTVTVADDPRDIRCLFLVLCCGKDFYHENDEPKPVEFAVLASLIRMGHKYSIPKIMNDALSRLKKYYPTTLSAWDEIDTREGYVATESAVHAFEVVRLARLTETPSLLPSAFFACCEKMCALSIKDDRLPTEGQLLLHGLSVQDSRRLIKGRENLALGVVERILKLVAKYSNLPADYRSSHRPCAEKVTAIFHLRALDGSFFKNTRYRAALQPLTEWFFANPTDPTGRPGLQCESCLKFLKRTDEKSRAEAWVYLPETFDLHVNGWPSSTE
ncbi:hypothetical protein V8D89_004227 [Ganoderma adspersum]